MPSQRVQLAIVAVLLAVVTVVLGAAHLAGSDRTASQSPYSTHPLAQTFAPDDTTLNDCASRKFTGGERGLCRGQALGNISFRQGPAAAFRQVTSLLGGQNRTTWMADSHVVTHFIGAGALRRNDSDLGLTFGQGSTMGSAGFYHALVIAGLRGHEQTLPARGSAICNSTELVKRPWVRYQCLHGLGHGVMILLGYDLPRSLTICDGIDGSVQDRHDCKTGVFMENHSSVLGVDSGVRSKWLKYGESQNLSAEQLLYPCNAVAERHKQACYVQVAARIGPPKWNWRRIAKVCHQADRGYAKYCLDSMGLWVSYWAGADVKQQRRWCAQVSRPDEVLCVAGAVRAQVANDIDNPAIYRRAAKLCNGSVAEVATGCFFGVGTVLQNLPRERHTQICHSMTSQRPLLAECLRGDRPRAAEGAGA